LDRAIIDTNVHKGIYQLCCYTSRCLYLFFVSVYTTQSVNCCMTMMSAFFLSCWSVRYYCIDIFFIHSFTSDFYSWLFNFVLFVYCFTFFMWTIRILYIYMDLFLFENLIRFISFRHDNTKYLELTYWQYMWILFDNNINGCMRNYS